MTLHSHHLALYYAEKPIQNPLDNHIKMSKKVNDFIARCPNYGLVKSVDLANYPELACDPKIASLIMVIGMLMSSFCWWGDVYL